MVNKADNAKPGGAIGALAQVFFFEIMATTEARNFARIHWFCFCLWIGWRIVVCEAAAIGRDADGLDVHPVEHLLKGLSGISAKGIIAVGVRALGAYHWPEVVDEEFVAVGAIGDDGLCFVEAALGEFAHGRSSSRGFVLNPGEASGIDFFLAA